MEGSLQEASLSSTFNAISELSCALLTEKEEITPSLRDCLLLVIKGCISLLWFPPCPRRYTEKKETARKTKRREEHREKRVCPRKKRQKVAKCKHSSAPAHV